VRAIIGPSRTPRPEEHARRVGGGLVDDHHAPSSRPAQEAHPAVDFPQAALCRRCISAFSERSPWAAAARYGPGRPGGARPARDARAPGGSRRAPRRDVLRTPRRGCRTRLISRKSCELCRTPFYRNRGFCGTSHGRAPRDATNLQTVATKYYTHSSRRAARRKAPPAAASGAGVVELREPLNNARANRELRALLAQSFDLDSGDIRILHLGRDCTEVSPGGLPSLHRRSALINPGLKTWGFFLARGPGARTANPRCAARCADASSAAGATNRRAFPRHVTIHAPG